MISKAKKMKRYLPLYLMFLPGAIYLLINNYIPMAGLVVAFKKYNIRQGIFGSAWAGLKNFEFLFATPDAWVVTRNTILYNLVFIVLNTVLGILFAIFICDTLNKKLRKMYQSAILFPFLMSAVILSYIVYAFLSQSTGIANNSILPALGLDPVKWYSEAKYWPFILVFVNTWKGIGYGCLIYIAGINGIDLAYYEAAKLDGATKWQQIKCITIPSLAPTVITLTLMSVGRIFYSDFGLFYQVPRNSGMIYSTTNVIDTYVYRGLMEQSNVGMSAAAGFYQSVVGFALVLTANFIVKKFSKENALF
ncbi:ABC transporter permease [Anaerobium acetethylicum]|uniref:Putative aldouronate transport system permease protein n=1 Tax=Anaerobium acetethylicum TaxID=1619234 RepID=A0A1D3TY52_9FIRM|nr:ABC transporter permease subunit [Anaerobium acetethylicum]SCP99358.1 putative aldouronate transport system permease protein [Anaerobium acetethylicum]